MSARDLFENRGFSRYPFFHCLDSINIWIIKKFARHRSALAVIACFKRTFFCVQLWTHCNRWPSCYCCFIYHSATSTPLTPSRLQGVEKVSKNCNIIQYRVVMCRAAQSFDFCLTFFWQLALLAVPQFMIYDFILFVRNGIAISERILKVNFWVMGFY